MLDRSASLCRAFAREILLLREFLPPAAPDLSPRAVARWPAAAVPPSSGVSRADAPPPFHAARSLFVYAGDVRSAIVSSKYSGRPFPADAIAQRMRDALREPWGDLFPDGPPPTIVPVPVHPLKYLRRGFNLPALVGDPLARMLGWPFDPLVLSRRRERLPQAGLRLADRRGNVEGAFRVPRGKDVPARVLLLDDVYTSGATAQAAASALKIAGADHIVVVTIACAVP